jgi:hypothetical protein
MLQQNKNHNRAKREIAPVEATKKKYTSKQLANK